MDERLEILGIGFLNNELQCQTEMLIGQRGHLGGSVCDGGFELFPACFQRVNGCVQIIELHAVQDRLHRVLDLLFHVRKLRRQQCTLRCRTLLLLIGSVCSSRQLVQFILGQILAQSRTHTLVHLFRPNPVAAMMLVALIIMILALLHTRTGHSTAAFRADQPTGQHVIIAGRIFTRTMHGCRLDALHGVKQLPVNQRGAVVRAVVADCVLADVNAVREHVGQVDLVPLVALRVRDAAPVQVGEDLVLLFTRSVPAEDLLRDGTRQGVDGKPVIHDSVPERRTVSDELPLAEGFLLAALHLASQLGAVILVHALQQRLHDDALRGVGQMLSRGDHAHAVLTELVFGDGTVVTAACEPVKLVNEYTLKGAGLAVRKHPLELRTVVTRAGFGAVDVVPDDLQIVLGSVLLANVELSLDALLGLHDGAVAAVKYDFFHNKKSSLKKYVKSVRKTRFQT